MIKAMANIDGMAQTKVVKQGIDGTDKSQKIV
jgi:hypothetical protein